MDFFEARFTRNGSSRMFMQRAKIPRQFQLFVDIDILVSENCRNNLMPIKQDKAITYKRHRVPQQATRCTRRLLSKFRNRAKESTNSSSFWVLDNCLKSTPEISQPMAGVSCLTLVAEESRDFFSGSANNPRSVTGCCFKGSQSTFGNEGWMRDSPMMTM